MASSSGCTPLLRSAVPHNTGTSFELMVAARRATRSSSLLICSPSRYLCSRCVVGLGNGLNQPFPVLMHQL